jgi:hypothetical protein
VEAKVPNYRRYEGDTRKIYFYNPDNKEPIIDEETNITIDFIERQMLLLKQIRISNGHESKIFEMSIYKKVDGEKLVCSKEGDTEHYCRDMEGILVEVTPKELIKSRNMYFHKNMEGKY